MFQLEAERVSLQKEIVSLIYYISNHIGKWQSFLNQKKSNDTQKVSHKTKWRSLKKLDPAVRLLALDTYEINGLPFCPWK